MTDDLHTGELHPGQLGIERDIVLDCPAGEVWRLVGTAEGWQEWLVDRAAVDMAEGGAGTVIDDGIVRDIDVLEVDASRSVTFRWWERDDPGSASVVSIHVHDMPGGGSRLRITERVVPGGAHATTACSARPSACSTWSTWSTWEVRACLLALALHSCARV